MTPLHVAGGTPLQLRARQAWHQLPPPQRANRVLYGLAFASMLGLLLELGIGSRSSERDVASAPGSDTPRVPTSTRPLSPASSVVLAPAPITAGGVSLADIVAQVTNQSGADASSPAAGRSGAPGPPARTAAQPPAGRAPGGPSPSAGPSSPAPAPAAAQPGQPSASEPERDPPVSSPTTAATTATTRPRTTVTFDPPDFNFPDRTGTTRRDRR